MWPYIIAAGLLGLIPGVAYVLLFMEIWMIFQIAHSYHVDNTGEIAKFCVAAFVLSAVLKTVAHLFHAAPIVGQIANSVVAMLFVYGLYTIAEAHYAHLAKVGKHPDEISRSVSNPGLGFVDRERRDKPASCRAFAGRTE